MFFRLPWLRRIFSGLSPLRLGFVPRSFHVRFVVNKVSLGQVSLQVLQFSSVIIIPPMLHIHLYLSNRRTSGRILGTFKQSNPFFEWGWSFGWELWTETYFGAVSVLKWAIRWALSACNWPQNFV